MWEYVIRGRVDLRVGWEEVCGASSWFMNCYLHLFIYCRISFPLRMRSFCLFTSTASLLRQVGRNALMTEKEWIYVCV